MASETPIKIKSTTFQFEIDYYKTKDLPIGQFIFSPTFTAGGYDWALKYYPQDNYLKNQGSHISLFLVLRSEAYYITAQYTFKIFDKKKGYFVNIDFTRVSIFNYYNYYDYNLGAGKFISRDIIDDLYCVNGNLLISCDIRVITEPKVVKNYPGGLCDHIKKLGENREKCDVTFEVEGESIFAHKLILAARSPIFEAQLFGPMAESKMDRIKINEMKPEVFKALLHFIYTDQLAVDDTSDQETLSVELLQGLFVAADRYALDKLILMCEEQLAKNLSVDTVVTTLLLADRHSCAELKRKCLDFASDPENFLLVALTEEYLHGMPGAPALFSELSEKVKKSRFAKKQTAG